eukprot:886181-Pelagomonas_calceolata.AAC.1
MPGLRPSHPHSLQKSYDAPAPLPHHLPVAAAAAVAAAAVAETCAGPGAAAAAAQRPPLLHARPKPHPPGCQPPG